MTDKQLVEINSNWVLDTKNKLELELTERLNDSDLTTCIKEFLIDKIVLLQLRIMLLENYNKHRGIIK